MIDLFSNHAIACSPKCDKIDCHNTVRDLIYHFFKYVSLAFLLGYSSFFVGTAQLPGFSLEFVIEFLSSSVASDGLIYFNYFQTFYLSASVEKLAKLQLGLGLEKQCASEGQTVSLKLSFAFFCNLCSPEKIGRPIANGLENILVFTDSKNPYKQKVLVLLMCFQVRIFEFFFENYLPIYAGKKASRERPKWARSSGESCWKTLF